MERTRAKKNWFQHARGKKCNLNFYINFLLCVWLNSKFQFWMVLVIRWKIYSVFLVSFYQIFIWLHFLLFRTLMSLKSNQCDCNSNITQFFLLTFQWTVSLYHFSSNHWAAIRNHLNIFSPDLYLFSFSYSESKYHFHRIFSLCAHWLRKSFLITIQCLCSVNNNWFSIHWPSHCKSSCI